MSDELPWVDLRDVCSMYGVSYETAKNKVRTNTFDVPVFRLGKKLVIDRTAHEEYFKQLRENSMRLVKLKSPNG